MNVRIKPFVRALWGGVLLLGAALSTWAADIDIYLGADTSATSDRPNVLIVLDNSSNWASAAQHWPSIKQGQAEVRAIKQVISSLSDNINVGLLMSNDSGTNPQGGYIRSAVVQMTAANKTALSTVLDGIFANFGTPSEKSPSSISYSAMLFDAFKYFGGFTSPAHATDDVAGSPVDSTHFGVDVYADMSRDSDKADTRAYAPAYTKYAPPISSANSCAKNYIIFIGNGFPSANEANNPNMTALLTGVGGNTATINRPTCTASTVSQNCTASSTYTSCVNNAGQCDPATISDYATFCSSGKSCQCLATSGTSVGCTGSKSKYHVQACDQVTAVTCSNYSVPSGTAAKTVADKWTRFLYQTDVNAASGQQNVATFTIDVFKDAPDSDQTALLQTMAKVGGGQYYAATNEDAIVNALKDIFVQIQAVNSVFAATSLPVNATNRSQNENQVFIGMFRPDPNAKPRWYGNMKRYQFAAFGSAVNLADKDGKQAINSSTGFISDCATSFWTTDSGTYWQNVATTPSPAGKCTTSLFNIYSDSPDGSFVEKGSVAEVLRKGNTPAATTPSYAVSRTMYMLPLSGTSLSPFDSSSSGLSSSLVDFVKGVDNVIDENGNGSLTDTRASIHGDVVHSRPLPLNYGGSYGVVVYYGANDGTFRAVDGASGKELWSMVAPEGLHGMSRLQTNAPIIKYPNVTDPAATAKDYAFDGSTGVFQNLDNTKVWVFPSMRRGGRAVYGINVTNPNTPSVKWRFGCKNLTNDDDCTSGASAIGQTWSTPTAGLVKGFSTTIPVVVFGGGYDLCDDANTGSPSCSTAKGRKVFILNADTGAVLASFDTNSPVAADVTMVDADFDGYVDFIYVADTGGNLYRINLINPTTKTGLAASDWTMSRIGYTSGSSRKFLFAPAAVPVGRYVYLALGSGDREHPLRTDYPYTATVTNRFYVLLDDTQSTSAVDMDSSASMINNTTNPDCNATPLTSSSTKRGWFMDLPGLGEQTVTGTLVEGGVAFFSTNRPVPPTGVCGINLGEARGYAVNLFTSSGVIGSGNVCGGSRSGVFVGGGLPPSPVSGVVPINGKLTQVIIGGVQLDGGASSPIGGQTPPATLHQVRSKQYWYRKQDR